MSKYHILDGKDGAVINTIKSEEDFVKANYSHYKEAVEVDATESSEETPTLTAEEEARAWRDLELRDTDIAVPISDFPNHANIIKYRILLRDWPSTADFPSKKPTLAT
tara:strand:- start:987 stop:1310 length:324 start_codon:yes stop_codon:yes gene_type:complete